MILRRLLRSCGLAVGSLTILVAMVYILILIQGTRDEARPANAAVVLGAAQWDGNPSPVLQARLDHAIDLYRRGFVRSIVLTGGVGRNDTLSEAAASQKYLVDQGLPAEALLLEDQGATTWESMHNAVSLMHEHRINTVLIVSDPFHMLRSLKMARDMGLEAYGSPTRTSPISANRFEEARYTLRETWAYIAYIFAQQ